MLPPLTVTVPAVRNNYLLLAGGVAWTSDISGETSGTTLNVAARLACDWDSAQGQVIEQRTDGASGWLFHATLLGDPGKLAFVCWVGGVQYTAVSDPHGQIADTIMNVRAERTESTGDVDFYYSLQDRANPEDVDDWTAIGTAGTTAGAIDLPPGLTPTANPLNHVNLYSSTEVVGGAGCEDNFIAYLGGHECVLATNPYEQFGWSTAEGRYPTLIVKRKIDGAWQYDEERTKWASDIRVEGDQALVTQFYRYGFNSYNVARIVDSELPTEGGQLPATRAVVIGHYGTNAVKDQTFEQTAAMPVPAWTTLSTSGGFTVYDDDLRLIGSFLCPNVTDPVTGAQVSLSPRAMACDPTSVAGDERFITLYDAFYISNTDGRSQLNTASPGVVAADSTFDGSIGSWGSLAFATVTYSTTFSYDGAGSMRISNTILNTSASADSPRFRVRQNRTYRPSIQARAGTFARNIRLGVQWRNAAGNQIGSAVFSTGTFDAVGSWTLITGDAFLSPTDATFCEMVVAVASPAGPGEFHYFDAPYVTLETALSGTAATFCIQEFSWDGTTVVAECAPWSPGPQPNSTQNIHAVFDDAGNLWVARAGGTFLSSLNALMYEKIAGERTYIADAPLVTPSEWVGDVQTPGPCDTSEEWGGWALDYEVLASNFGGIATRPVWDADNSVMHMMHAGTPTTTAIERVGSAGAYTFNVLGNCATDIANLPESSSAYGATVGNPATGFVGFDPTRGLIWMVAASSVGGTWPKPPELFNWWMGSIVADHWNVTQAIDYYGKPGTFGTVDGATTSTGHTIDTINSGGFVIGPGQRPQRPVVTTDGLIHCAGISCRGNNAQATMADGFGLYTWNPESRTMSEQLVPADGLGDVLAAGACSDGTEPTLGQMYAALIAGTP